MAEASRSAFDFSDQYGTDPVLRRYAPVTSIDRRMAEAELKSSISTRQLAEANFAKAQAELNAQLAPMKFAQEQMTNMSAMLKMKSSIQEEAMVQKNAAAISDGLTRANNLDDVVALGNSHALGLRDSVVGPQWRTSALSGFRQAVDNAQSVVEVDAAFAKIPASVAAEPEFDNLYKNAKSQAERREGVQKAYAAEPSLGAVPTTQGGQIDVTAAGLAVAAMTGQEERRKTSIENAKILQKQIGDLRDQMKEDALSETGVKESDTLLLETYQTQFERSLLDAGVLPGATSASPTTATGTGDAVGALLPTEANRGVGAPAAAAASSAATGGETAAAPTPTVAAAPATLEQEARQAAETAAPRQTAPGAGRAVKATEAKRKRDEANRIKLLKDERTKLQSAIYQKLGRGGGGGLTTRLKPGLSGDNEVVQKTLTRINEITAEIGE